MERKDVEIMGMEMEKDLKYKLKDRRCMKIVGYDMKKKDDEKIFKKKK